MNEKNTVLNSSVNSATNSFDDTDISNNISTQDMTNSSETHMKKNIDMNTEPPSTKHVHAPASKSVSHRMLMGAALANGESIVSNVLESKDLMQTMEILTGAGAKFEKIDTGTYRVQGASLRGNADFNNPLSCDVHESGTTCRLLTAILASGQGYFYIHGAERMNERPIGTLTSCLEKLGSKFHFQKQGYPPFILFANGLKGGEITISLEESSQYLSGLLLAAPLAKEPVTIYIGGRHVVSWPYVGLTLQAMKAFGAQFDVCILDKSQEPTSINTTEEIPKKWKIIDWHTLTEIVPGEIRFRVRPFKKSSENEENAITGYKAGKYLVEGDWSGASYLLAAGAIGKNPVTVHGLNKHSVQADKALLSIMEQMNVTIRYGNVAEQTITIHPSKLKGIEVNMTDCPDIVPTVAVLAAFAHGTTKITGVEHLRIKECDRLNAMAQELQRAGVQVIEEQDGLIIQGLKTSEDDLQSINYTGKSYDFLSYGDHRIVMSLSLFELAGASLAFDNPHAITKSFPDFWDIWKTICA